MPEIVAVVLLLLLIFAFAIVEVVPWPNLVEAGNAFMLRCAALGVPLEVVYFTALGIALTLSGTRPKGWYWRSFQHHHLLSRTQKWLVLPFFYTGAVSFVGIVLGILVVVLGMIGAVRQG